MPLETTATIFFVHKTNKIHLDLNKIWDESLTFNWPMPKIQSDLFKSTVEVETEFLYRLFSLGHKESSFPLFESQTKEFNELTSS